MEAEQPASSTSAKRARRWRERQKQHDPAYLEREAARLRDHRKRQAEQRSRQPMTARQGFREPWETAD